MQHLPATDKIDMEYLKSDAIGKVIARGLAELYKNQPTYPVNYLANWLLNYSKSQKNYESLDATIKHRELLVLKQQHEHEAESHRQAQLREKEDALLKEDQRFRDEVERTNFHENFLCKEFCDYLVEKQGGLTGVYVGYVDFPPKPLNENDDDETAHQYTDQPKIIRYVGANKNHHFMIGQTLSLEAGVTGKVFEVPPVPDVPEGEAPPPPPSTAQYIPSVVHEPKVVYFQWPKLGAYFAVPLVYQSCLLAKSLDIGMESRLSFKKNLADTLKEREQKEAEYNERIKAAQEAGEEVEPLIEELNAVKSEWQELREPDFFSEKREFVVCFDTLGQDREISAEARQYFEEFTYFFGQKWEQKEKQLLSADIDALINYYENVSTKERSDQMTVAEDLAVDSAQMKFDELKDREKEFQFEIQSARLAVIQQQLSEPQLYNEFLALKEMRVLKFPGILQALLIFLGYMKEEINFPGTNILDWTKVKSTVHEGLFEKIANYSHRGPRTDAVYPYAKIGRLSKRLEKFDLEQVENYNVCYGKVLKWLQLSLQLRRQDIEIRRIKIQEKKQLRETRQQEVERIKEAKQNALADAKGALSPEEQETFNQEEWEGQYDSDHPLPEIPDDVEQDIDEDYDEI